MKKVWKKVVTLALSVTVIAQTLLGQGLTITAKAEATDYVTTTVYDLTANKTVTVYVEDENGTYKLVDGEYVELADNEMDERIDNPDYYTGTRYVRTDAPKYVQDDNGTLDAEGNALTGDYTTEYIETTKVVKASQRDADAFVYVTKYTITETCTKRDCHEKHIYNWYSYHYTAETNFVYYLDNREVSGYTVQGNDITKGQIKAFSGSGWDMTFVAQYNRTTDKNIYKFATTQTENPEYVAPADRYAENTVQYVYTESEDGTYKLVDDSYVELEENEIDETMANDDYYAGTRYTKDTETDRQTERGLSEAEKDAAVASYEEDGYTVDVKARQVTENKVAERINFKYYNLEENYKDITTNADHASAGYNTIKYTVELQDTDGSLITGDEATAFYALFDDVTVNAVSVSDLEAALADESIEGYSYDSTYFYWNYDSKTRSFSNATNVDTFLNKGCKGNNGGYSYDSFIAFYKSASDKGNDYRDGGYAYNPTGFLHVVYVKNEAPAITVSAEGKVYDGIAVTATSSYDEDGASVDENLKGGSVAYEYKDAEGNVVDEAVDAGTYTVTATYTAKSGAQSTDSTSFEITKKPVTITCHDYTITKGDMNSVVDGQVVVDGNYNNITKAILAEVTVDVENVVNVTEISISESNEITAEYAFASGENEDNYDVTVVSAELIELDPNGPFDEEEIAALDSTVIYNGQDQLDEFLTSINELLDSKNDYTFELLAPDTAKDAGVYAVTIKSNYKGEEFDDVVATLTINPRNVKIVVDDAVKNEGEEDPQFTATVSNAAEGENVNLYIWRVLGDDYEEAGTYNITASIATNFRNNYTYTVIDGTLTILAVEEPVVTPVAPTPAPVVVEPVVEEPVVEEPVVEEPVVEEPVVEEPVIEELPEEETPLAYEAEELPEDEVPLAVDLREDACWIHWLLIALTGVYAVYALARCVARSRKIKELEGESESVEE